ncbi:MAG: glutamine--fructose-6-phosphate aminotransferase, partial [Fuerstiella sp.]|nr:glutamine--fructose-6-phosphate aminotransferase [Fuerstiella sp.]
MCGIVGYVGFRAVSELLLEGLHRLEYRGYDSAGIAVMADDGIVLRKRAGRVCELSALLEEQPVRGSIGIGHTRWATHGETTDENSHPHIGGNGEVAIVHNGVIENYIALRNQLQQLGYVFQSQTDTEVVAHLIAHHLSEQTKQDGDEPCMKTCLRAINLTLDRLKGTFGLCVLFRDCPDTVIAARAGSPLVIGVAKDEYFLASDASPLIGYTKEVVYLADNEVAVLQPSGIQITHRTSGSVRPSIQTLDQ